MTGKHHQVGGLPVVGWLRSIAVNHAPSPLDWSQIWTDLYIQQDIGATHGTRSSIGFSVSNLFNQDMVTSKFVTETESGAGLAIDEADLYAGRLDFEQLFAQQRVLRDPRFLRENAYQAPRSARVMLKWSF